MSASLRIIARGQGPDLVLLHGWAVPSGIWGGVVDALATQFRVNLVDLPGHGINQDVPLSTDLNSVAKLISSEVPPAIWIGWSLGGLITLAAAIAQPQKVKKMVLVTATPSFAKQPGWEHGADAGVRQTFTEALAQDCENAVNQFFLQVIGPVWVDDCLRRLRVKAQQT
jgi:pimeloyl-[acyl-carrier protein] methyl ester esterase